MNCGLFFNESVIMLIIPLEIIIEIAKCNGIAAVKLAACSRGLREMVPKLTQFGAMCRLRVEYDGRMLLCDEHCVAWMREKNKITRINNVIHGDHDFRLFRCYNGYSVLMLAVGVKSLIRGRDMLTQISVIRRNEDNGIVNVVNDLVDTNKLTSSEWNTAKELFDDHAISLYGSKIRFSSFEPPM